MDPGTSRGVASPDPTFSRRRRLAAAGAPLLCTALLLAGCATRSPRPLPTTAVVAPTAPSPPLPSPAPAASGDSLSPEETRDLEAIQTVRFEGPVGSSNDDLDEELEDFLSEESTALLTEQVDFDIPIVINERVEYFIDYFQNRVSMSFTKWLARAPQYVPYLRERFRAAGLPEDLIYISLIESGFSAQATSRSNAVGYWQFIEATGRRYGLRVDRWVDERRDLERSTGAAIAYLKDLHVMFGSWYLAAAAYNSGEGRIQRAIEKYDSENLWELAEFSYLREETKDYVPKLIAATLIAKEPERYGFHGVPGIPALEFDLVSLPAQTDLAVVAAAAGTTVETIRTLNPLLRSHATPPGASAFQLKVPKGSGAAFTERLARVPPPLRLVERYHTVRRGESPGRIASNYGVTAARLMAENGIRNARKLRIGQRLRIPRSARDGATDLPPQVAEALRAPVKPARAVVDVPMQPVEIAGEEGPRLADVDATGTPRRVATPAAVHGASSGPAESGSASSRAAAVYERGEPLPARDEGTSAPTEPAGPVELASAPKEPAGPVEAAAARAEPGPVRIAAAPVPLAPADPPPRRVRRTIRYRVKPGDTLYRIARSHGVTVAEMERWNPQASSRIAPGTVVLIRPISPPAGVEPEVTASLAGRPGSGVGPRILGAAAERLVLEVNHGDTLYSIAQRHNVSLEQVRRWNDLPDDTIRAGDSLVLYPDGLEATPR